MALLPVSVRCSKSISSDELGTLQENLIRAMLACGRVRPVIIVGKPDDVAQGACPLGHGGVQVITVQRILGISSITT